MAGGIRDIHGTILSFELQSNVHLGRIDKRFEGIEIGIKSLCEGMERIEDAFEDLTENREDTSEDSTTTDENEVAPCSGIHNLIELLVKKGVLTQLDKISLV